MGFVCEMIRNGWCATPQGWFDILTFSQGSILLNATIGLQDGIPLGFFPGPLHKE
jgi:hypothetical protein